MAESGLASELGNSYNIPLPKYVPRHLSLHLPHTPVNITVPFYISISVILSLPLLCSFPIMKGLVLGCAAAREEFNMTCQVFKEKSNYFLNVIKSIKRFKTLMKKGKGSDCKWSE